MFRCLLSLTYSVLPSGLTSMPLAGPHLRGRQEGLAVPVDAPDLAGAVVPVGVAGVERAIRGDGQVVGLVHLVVVGEDGDFLCLRVDAQDIVADVIGDVHLPLGVEDDAVAGALAGQGHADLAFAVGSDLADGLLLGEVDDIDVAPGIAGRALDAGGKGLVRGERRGDEKLFLVGGDQRSQEQNDGAAGQKGNGPRQSHGAVPRMQYTAALRR